MPDWDPEAETEFREQDKTTLGQEDKLWLKFKSVFSSTLVTYRLAAAELRQWDDASVWTELQVQQVKWRTGPEVNTGGPE